MKIACLSNRALIEICGDDVESFLQRIITNDIKKLSNNNGLYSLMLTPKGKFLYDFFLFKMNDSIFLDVDSADLDGLYDKIISSRINDVFKSRKIIKKYKILSLFETGDPSVKAKDFCFIYKDPRSNKLGYRAVVEIEVNIQDNANLDEYEYMRINNLIPDGTKDLSKDRSFPFDYGLEGIGAIDFEKGCYVGQEVVSRLKFRSQPKKRVYLVDLPNECESGTVSIAGREVGEIKFLVKDRALISLRNSDVEKVRDGAVLDTESGTISLLS